MARSLILSVFCIFLYASAYAAVELDADHNGAIDIGKGGSNATSAESARANIGAVSSADLALKADTAVIYTKTQLDTMFSGYATTTALITGLAGKANISGVSFQIADFSGLQKCTDTNWTTCVDIVSSAPTDDNSQVWTVAATKSYTSAAISSAIGGISGGGAAEWTKVSSDPTVLSVNGTYLNLADGGLWYKDYDTLCKVGAACLPIYDISLTITDTIPTNDTFTINSVAYDVNDSVAVIPTLSNASVGLHYDGSHTASCSGTGISGSSPNWTVNAISDRSVNCTITAVTSTFLQDTFTSASTVSLLSHSPETGGPWVQRDGELINVVGGYGWIKKSADSSSELAINQTASTYQNMRVAISGRLVTAATTRVIYALARMNASMTNGYYAVIYGDGTAKLSRLVSGVGTAITAVSSIPSFSISSNYTLEITANGSTIGYVVKDSGGTVIVSDSATDTNITAAGYAGVGFSSIDSLIFDITAESL